MLDEKKTVAALKAAYKGGGYRVAFTEGTVLIRAGEWAAEIDAEYIWPKILGTIVEHIGMLPERPAAYTARKGMDPGSTCMLDEELAAWAELDAKAEAATTPIRRTRLQIEGYEVWQTGQELRARLMDPYFTQIIDDEGANRAYTYADGDRLGAEICFKGFVETVIITGVKYSKASSAMQRIDGFPWLGEGS